MIVSVKPPLELKKRQLTSRQKLQPKVALGAKGESQAVFFLKQHGFTVLDQNVRLGTSEVDIIATDPKSHDVVFVEVKTRSTDQFGHPTQAVNRRKLLSLHRVAKAYLKHRALAKDYRFDIISILPTGIEHFENVTWYS